MYFTYFFVYRLLTQFKAAFKQVSSEQDFPTVEDFMRKYRMDCPAALVRIKEDRPITVKDDRGNTQKMIADTVALFITSQDKLRMDILAKDDLYIDVKDLYDYLQQLSILPDDFEGKEKVGKWLKTLNQMEAGDEIDKDQARQMAFDLESSYAAFNSVLSRM